jgi:hypothetical protein
MNEVEASINDLIQVVKFIPKERLDEIMNFVATCQFNEALWRITAYLDPFLEDLEVFPVVLLVKSWALLCRYHRLLVREGEEDCQFFCANGQQNILAQGFRLFLQQSRESLETSEEGMRRATGYFERTMPVGTKMKPSVQTFKAKCT